MATFVDRPYYGWSHEEISDHNESQEGSVSQMLDHGSISFGRFAFESLSWEKRSVFTHNKCQEELEKFKCPGLVAQKKAYFEEYYKKIRAMKALQENHQAELDCGGDGSISSQTIEEDETAVQLESVGDGTANAVDGHPEEASLEVTIEKEKECGETLKVQIRHLDLNITLPNLDSSRESLEAVEQEKNSSYALQMQNLETKSTNESLIRSLEEIEQHYHTNIDDKGITRKYRNSDLNVESEITSQAAAQYPMNSKPERVDLNPNHNMVQQKQVSAVIKHKERLSLPKVKDLSASVRNDLKLECKNKSDIIKASQGPKYPFRKTVVKADSSYCSNKGTADRVSRNCKSTSFASYRPLTEVHSNVTIPRPFSLATASRAAVPSGTKEGSYKSDYRTSNKLASSPVNGKDARNEQGTSKRFVLANGMTSRGLENQRGPEERKRPLALNSQCTNLKGRGENVLGQRKQRSLNLPARNKFSSVGGIYNRSVDAVRGEKWKEVKDRTGLSKIRGDGKKIVAPPQAGNIRTETKKMVLSRNSDLSVNGRKPQIGERQSLNGKKPRQERPRWR